MDEQAKKDEVDYFSRYIEFLKRFGAHNINRIEEVKNLQAQAMGYVWGWQDANKERDSQVSWNFSYAYGVYAAEFAFGITYKKMPIQDAFQSWLKTGEIRWYGEY